MPPQHTSTPRAVALVSNTRPRHAADKTADVDDAGVQQGTTPAWAPS